MLTPNDFLRGTEPEQNGKLTLTLFPGWTAARLDAFLQAQITRAYADARVAALPDDGTRDRAASAFVYLQSFESSLIEVGMSSTRADMERVGSTQYDRAAQIKMITGLRDGAADDLAAVLTPEAPSGRRRRSIRSGAVQVERVAPSQADPTPAD